MDRKRIFVDTSAWFALQITDDRNHQMAQILLRRALEQKAGSLNANDFIHKPFQQRSLDEALQRLRIRLQSDKPSP